MVGKLMCRFAVHFRDGILGTLRDKIVDGLVFGGGLLYFFARGAIAQKWDDVTPVVWAVLSLIAYHAIVAAGVVSREIKDEVRGSQIGRRARIYDASGSHPTLTDSVRVPRSYNLWLAAFAATLTLMSGCLALATYRLMPAASPLFRLDVRASIVSDRGPLTQFIAAYPSILGPAISPVFYLSYLRITNLQSVPTSISDFKIAVSKDAAGPWQELTPISLSSSQIYMLGKQIPHAKRSALECGTLRLATQMTNDDLRVASLFVFSPKLEDEFRQKINPHSTVEGWVALDSPRKEGLSPGQVFYRISVRDAANNGGTYIAELPQKNFGDSSFSPNCGQIAVTDEWRDLSSFRFRYYGDPPIPRP